MFSTYRKRSDVSFILLGVVLLTALLHPCFANAQDVVPDCTVLEGFKLQLNIASTQSDWCCQPPASPFITCNTAEPPRVTNITIQSKQLPGTLPENIGDLTELMVFDVRYNQLSGSLPKSVSNLRKLKELVLYFNSFGTAMDVHTHARMYRVHVLFLRARGVRVRSTSAY